MSEWFEITDPEDIDLALSKDELHICFNQNDFGNQYVFINKELFWRILECLKEADEPN